MPTPKGDSHATPFSTPSNFNPNTIESRFVNQRNRRGRRVNFNMGASGENVNDILNGNENEGELINLGNDDGDNAGELEGMEEHIKMLYKHKIFIETKKALEKVTVQARFKFIQAGAFEVKVDLHNENIEKAIEVELGVIGYLAEKEECTAEEMEFGRELTKVIMDRLAIMTENGDDETPKTIKRKSKPAPSNEDEENEVYQSLVYKGTKKIVENAPHARRYMYFSQGAEELGLEVESYYAERYYTEITVLGFLVFSDPTPGEQIYIEKLKNYLDIMMEPLEQEQNAQVLTTIIRTPTPKKKAVVKDDYEVEVKDNQRKVRQQRMSYGSAPKRPYNEESDEEQLPDKKRKNSGSSNKTVVNTRAVINPGNQGNTMMVNFIQPKSIRNYDGIDETKASQFLRDYERLAGAWNEEQKVDSFGNYLDAPASHWLTLIENLYRKQTTYTEDGRPSNKWKEMKWRQLRRLFQDEYMPNSVKEFFTVKQADDELGQSFFYRATAVHSDCGIELEEDALVKVIIERLSPAYYDKFQFADIETMDKLRKGLIAFDKKRSQLMAAKKALERKQTSLVSAINVDEITEKGVGAQLEKLTAAINAIGKEPEPPSMETQLEKLTAAVCAYTGGGEQQQQRQKSCYECGSLEHFARTCPKKEKKRDENCYNCGMNNHYARDCKNKTNNGGQRGGQKQWNNSRNKFNNQNRGRGGRNRGDGRQRNYDQRDYRDNREYRDDRREYRDDRREYRGDRREYRDEERDGGRERSQQKKLLPPEAFNQTQAQGNDKRQ
jgi:hypothetical protein